MGFSMKPLKQKLVSGIPGYFSKREKPEIGLDIKDHAIRLVEPDLSGNGTVGSFAEKSLPAGVVCEGKISDKGTLIQVVKECVDEWGIKNRKVRFNVPDPYIFLRRIHVPAHISDDEVKGYLYMESGSSIHVPFHNPVFDFHVVKKAKEKKEILLFASPEKVIGEYAGVLETAKLRPERADVATLSIYRLIRAYYEVKPGEHIINVQVEPAVATVSVYTDHTPFFIHHVFLNEKEDGSGFTAEQSGDTDGLAEPLTIEVNRVINFYCYAIHKGDVRISRIFTSGDHPRLSDFENKLSASFDIPVTASSSHTPMETAAGREIPSRFFPTMGLALEEVS